MKPQLVKLFAPQIAIEMKATGLSKSDAIECLLIVAHLN